MKNVNRWKWMWVVVAAVLAWPAGLLVGQSKRSDDVARLKRSAQIFQEVMATPDKGIPEEILGGAQCVAIIPGMKTGAIGIGANYGKGVATCRSSAQGAWGPPLFITLGGGSFGLQLGGESSDIVMVFGTRRQLDSLLSSKFRVGGEAAAAAGPVGRHVEAGTDVKLNAQILTYGRSKGAFAGISLNGSVVQPDSSGNQAMYGEHANEQDILSGSGVTMPPEAEPLIKELDRHPATKPAGGR